MNLFSVLIKKTSDGSLIEEFEVLINQCADAFNQQSAWRTGYDLAFGTLNCMGRHTVTGMLTASGQQFMDWSPAYRLFNQARVDTSKLYDVVRCCVLQELDSHQFIVAHMDDTILKKNWQAHPRDSLAPGPSGASLSNQFYLGSTLPADINGSTGSP